MVKASWGTKRTCQNCAARFYDLNKSPIKCPKCGREHDREDFVKVRRGRASAAATRRHGGGGSGRRQARPAPRARRWRTARSTKKRPTLEADDDALEDTDDLADEAEDIEVEVEDDKGEGDR